MKINDTFKTQSTIVLLVAFLFLSMAQAQTIEVKPKSNLKKSQKSLPAKNIEDPLKEKTSIKNPPAEKAESLKPNEDGGVSKKDDSYYSKVKSTFTDWVSSIGELFFTVAQGPRVNERLELPEEFKKTKYIVKRKVPANDLLYVQALDSASLPKEGDVFFAYILEDQSACELEVLSVVTQWILVRNKTCQRFGLVYPGAYLLPKIKSNAKKWRPKYSNDYISTWLQLGKTSMRIEDTNYGGTNARYGVRAALDLSKISRVQLNYGVGKNDLSSASSGVVGPFQGVTSSSFHVLGRWSESWQTEYKGFEIIPMLGIGTIFEVLDGHPTLQSAGGGPTFGLLAKSHEYKSVFDVTLNFCLIGCQSSEVGDGLVGSYKSPASYEFRLTAKSHILPWSGWSLLSFFEYSKLSSSRAYTNSETPTARAMSHSYWGLGFGVAYSWK